MEVNDSSSSHASCESDEEYGDGNVDILVKQLDINVLIAALLEEKCVSLEQDGDRGHRLSTDVYNYLEQNGIVKSLSHEMENSLPMQKKIFNKIVQTLAQNATEEDLPGANETTITTALCTRYRNDFEQIKELGRGGFGIVYEARHNLDGMKYAVKATPREDTEIAKPLREVRALACLKHPNIMGYHTSWVEDYSYVSTNTGTSSEESEGSSESFSTSNSDEDALQEPDKNINVQPGEGILYIQMELCDRTLHDWLEERRNTSTLDYETFELHPDVRQIFRGILCGVSFIHSKGLMHRDLKPANIFLMGSNLHVKIGDFGLIKSVNGTDSICSSPTVEGGPVDFNTTTRYIGSEMYGSPELLSGQRCNTKCDIYSLGILLFEMCNTFTTGMERIEIIRELRKKHCCPGKLRRIWSELKIQLIEELINPEAERRPTAEKVLKNLLLGPERQIQLIEESINPVAELKSTAEEVLKNPLLGPEPQIQLIKEPINPVAELRPAAEEVVKNPLFGPEPQTLHQTSLLQNQAISMEVRKDKKPYQEGVKHDQKSQDQVQTNTVELSQDASSDAQLMGFTNKKKK